MFTSLMNHLLFLKPKLISHCVGSVVFRFGLLPSSSGSLYKVHILGSSDQAPLILRSCYSVTKLCPALCNPMDCSMLGFPVLHQLLEFAQTHVHWVRDVIQPFYALSPPSFAPNLSQHQGLFQWVSSLHQVAKVLELYLSLKLLFLPYFSSLIKEKNYFQTRIWLYRLREQICIYKVLTHQITEKENDFSWFF